MMDVFGLAGKLARGPLAFAETTAAQAGAAALDDLKV
jgi:hypothetical protein